MVTFIKRMIRAVVLDAELYEEIPVNHNYIYQSIILLFISSLATGIACYPDDGVFGFILVTIIAIFCWILWGFLTFFISDLLMRSEDQSVDIKEVIRITGFASAPGIIRFFGIFPGLYGIVFFISGIWMLVTMAMTIKHAYEFDMLRALSVSLIGGIIPSGIFVIFL